MSTNIEITDIKGKEATAKYTFVMKMGDNEKQQDIVLNAIKVAGKWKLDGKQFFPGSQVRKNRTNDFK